MTPQAVKLGARITLVRFRRANDASEELRDVPHAGLNKPRTITRITQTTIDIDSILLPLPRQNELTHDEPDAFTVLFQEPSGYRLELSYRLEPQTEEAAHV